MKSAKADKIIRDNAKILLLLVMVLAAVLLFSPSSVVAAAPDILTQEVFKYPPHVVQQEGDTLWQLWYMQAGTKSQGIHGKLYINGQEIQGTSLDEEKKVDQKIFVWYGSFANRKNIWDWSGWLPKDIDPEKFKKSQYTTRAGWLILSGQINRVTIEEKDGDIFCRLGKVYKSDPIYYELCLGGRWLGKGKDGEMVKSAFGEHEFVKDGIAGPAGWMLTEKFLIQ